MGFPSTTFSVTPIGSGTGSVKSNDGKITCPGDCSETYLLVSPSGQDVTLTAATERGSVFLRWGGDCVKPGTGSSCTLTTEFSRSVTARFEVLRRVTVDLAGSGKVVSTPAGIACPGTCSAQFPAGTSLTLGARPDSGFAFAGWKGACSGTDNCVLSLRDDITVGATFKSTTTTSPPPTTTKATLQVTVTGAGKVTSSPGGIACSGAGTACSSQFDSGVRVVLTATPDAGFQIQGWGGACATATRAAQCGVSPSGTTLVSMSFAEKPVAAPEPVVLTVVRKGDGTVTSSPAGIDCGADCTVTIAPGTPVNLTAKAAAGSVFEGWTGGPCDGTNTNSCSWQESTAATVTATFAPRAAGEPPPGETQPPPTELPPAGGKARQPLDIRVRVLPTWTTSVFRGSLSLAGEASKAGTLRAKLTLVKRVLAAARAAAPAPVNLTLRVPAGEFAGTLRLPPSLLPGRYEVIVSVEGSQESRRGLILLPPPPEGVVSKAVISSTERGKATARLPAGAKKVFVRFDVATRPRLRPITVRWIAPNGKPAASVQKAGTPTITSFLLSRSGLPRGSWKAVLRAGGKVVKTAPFRVG